jgi:hypothetical protein
MIDIATLHSSHVLKDSSGFTARIESVLRRAMGILIDEEVEDEPNDGAKVIND